MQSMCGWELHRLCRISSVLSLCCRIIQPYLGILRLSTMPSRYLQLCFFEQLSKLSCGYLQRSGFSRLQYLQGGVLWTDDQLDDQR